MQAEAEKLESQPMNDALDTIIEEKVRNCENKHSKL